MSEVLEMLDKHSIEYKTAGKDLLVHCWNPEHADSSPSLRIDKDSGLYRCPACGFKGSLYKYFNVNKDVVNDRVSRTRKTLRSMIPTFIELPPGSVPFITDYRDIGYKTYKEFEAFKCPGDDETYEDRLLFPIRDILGNIKFICGRRTLSSMPPKYKNFPEGAAVIPYPPVITPIDNTVILVEGIFDMLNLWDKGLKNVVCTFGTHTLMANPELLQHYRLLGASRFIIMFDGDEAGQKAATDLEAVLGKSNVVTIYTLPEHLDPGSLTKAQVSEVREDIYEN